MQGLANVIARYKLVSVHVCNGSGHTPNARDPPSPKRQPLGGVDKEGAGLGLEPKPCNTSGGRAEAGRIPGLAPGGKLSSGHDLLEHLCGARSLRPTNHIG